MMKYLEGLFLSLASIAMYNGLFDKGYRGKAVMGALILSLLIQILIEKFKEY